MAARIVPGGLLPPPRDTEQDLLRAAVDLESDALVHGILQRPGKRVTITRVILSDITRFALVAEIPANAIEFEIHILGTGTVSIAHVPVPGGVGAMESFDDVASGDRITRHLAGVNIFGQPANAGAILVITVTLP